MGCNKTAIRLRVNPQNINSTGTMYEQSYALCFFFQQPRLSIFSIGPPSSTYSWPGSYEGKILQYYSV